MRVLGGVAVALLLSACGPKTMDARLRDAEKLADRAAVHLDEAEKAMAALEPKKMESALEDAKEALGEKDIELYPEAQMHLDRYQELASKLPQVKAAREKRDLELRLNAARDKIVPRVQALLEAQEAVLGNAPTRAAVEAVESKAKAVKEAVDDEQELFVKDADFAAWAKSQRNKVEKALEGAARAKKGVAFLEGPVVAWKEGLALQSEAKGKKILAEKEAAQREARTKLTTCEKNAKPFDEDKVTGGVAFVMPSGKPQTPGQLAVSCQKALKDLDGEWKKTVAALEVETKKQKALEAKEKAKAEKLAKEQAAKEAKEAKAKAARDAKEAKAQAAREAKEKKEQAARDAKEKKEQAARDAKEKKEQAARDAKEKKEQAARDAKEKKEQATRDAKEKKEQAARDAKEKKEQAARDAKEKAERAAAEKKEKAEKAAAEKKEKAEKAAAEAKQAKEKAAAAKKK